MADRAIQGERSVLEGRHLAVGLLARHRHTIPLPSGQCRESKGKQITINSHALRSREYKVKQAEPSGKDPPEKEIVCLCSVGNEWCRCAQLHKRIMTRPCFLARLMSCVTRNKYGKGDWAWLAINSSSIGIVVQHAKLLKLFFLLTSCSVFYDFSLARVHRLHHENFPTTSINA